MKYSCSKTKQEILTIIAQAFEKCNNEYEQIDSRESERTRAYTEGAFTALYNVIRKLEIYEK